MKDRKLAEGPKGGIPEWKKGEEIDLQIVHWCLFGPHLSGMYETTRELIAAENRIEGVLAGLCETPNPDATPAIVKKAAQGGKVDAHHPELITQDWGWGMKWADVHMVHSTMSTNVARLAPKAYFSHGTVEACLGNEMIPGDKRKSFTSSAEWVEKFEAAFVTSRRAEFFWGVFDHTGEKVHRVNKGIDLEWWQRSTTAMQLEGEPSVLYGEIWRGMKHPLHLLYAVNELHKENKKIRLNMWGCNIKRPFWEKMIKMAYFDDFIGKHWIQKLVDYPEHYYSRGDVLVSPGLYADPSRILQEAMACGCPVIAWDSDPWGDSHAYRYAKAFDPKDLAVKIMEVYQDVLDDRNGVSKKCRTLAEKYFDINKEAKQIVKVLRKVVSEHKA